MIKLIILNFPNSTYFSLFEGLWCLHFKYILQYNPTTDYQYFMRISSVKPKIILPPPKQLAMPSQIWIISKHNKTPNIALDNIWHIKFKLFQFIGLISMLSNVLLKWLQQSPLPWATKHQAAWWSIMLLFNWSFFVLLPHIKHQ